MTPEEIENIPNESITEIKRLALELHESTTGILETPLPAREIERQFQLRTAVKLKVDGSVSFLKAQISDFEALIRDLRTVKGYATADESRLKSYFFSTLQQEKAGNA